MKRTFVFIFLGALAPIFAGCDEQPASSGPEICGTIESRAPSPCDPEVAAAELFRDAPAEIPRAHVAATCDLAHGLPLSSAPEHAVSCKEIGDVEICCKPRVGGWTCCINNGGTGEYKCGVKLKTGEYMPNA